MAETKYKTLGEIGTFVRGGGLQKKDFRDNGVPCIHYGQVYTHYGSFADKTISFISPELASTLKKAQKGDIIIVCTSENVEDVCKCVVWLGEEDVCVGGETYIFKHNQDPRYLAYNFLTEAFIDFKKKNYTGTKVFRIHENELKTFSVPLPPLTEQHAIASALTAIDNLIASIDKQIAKTQSVKQGAMQQLFCSLLDNSALLKPLGEMCRITTGKLDVNAKDDGGLYPFFTCDAKPYRINTYAFDTTAILISGNGSHVGHINYYSGKFNAYQRTYVLSNFVSWVYDKHLLHYLKAYLRPYITKDVRKASIPFITLPMLKNFLVPIPSMETQHRIASTLTAIDDQISALEAKRRKYEMVKVGMMQQLLTGKIRLS